MRTTATTTSLCCALALLASLLSAPPALAADGLSGRLVFVRESNLWLLDLADQGLRQLTTSGDCSAPSWSPDGGKLVYVRSQSWKEGQLWVLDVEAGKAARLTTKPSDYQCPRWSPDGEWIACFAYDDGVQPTVNDNPYRVVKVNLATKAATVLAKGVWGAKALAWSPESSALVYSYGTEGDATLAALLVNDATVEPRVLRQTRAADGPEVTIADVRWPVPEAIHFCEFDAAEQSSLTIRQVKADGKVTVVQDFGEAGNSAMPLSAATDGTGPWLLTKGDESGLFVWADGKTTPLLEDAREATWAPAR